MLKVLKTAYSSFQHDPRPLCTLSGHKKLVRTIAFLPDGQRLVTGSDDKTVRIWNVVDGRQKGKEIDHAAAVYYLAVTNEGDKIISGDDSGRITVWDTETHELVKEWKHTAEYPLISISADDRLAIVGYGKTTIAIHKLTSEGTQHNIEACGVSSLCFSPDGSKLVCGGWEVVKVYSVDTGRWISTLGPGGHDHWVDSVQWSREGTRIYSSSRDTTIRCWNTKTWEQIGPPWRGHNDWPVFSLSLSPDGTKIASGADDKTVCFWNKFGHPIGHPLEVELKVMMVCISPLNDVVAVAGRGKKVSIWQVPWSHENQPDKPTNPPVPFTANSFASLSTPSPAHTHVSENAPQDASSRSSLSQWRMTRNSSENTSSATSDHQNPSQTIDSGRQDRSQAISNDVGDVASSPQIEPVATSDFSLARASSSAHGSSNIKSSPAPLDLTQYIVKLDELYLEGGSFGDIYRCRYYSPTGCTEVAVKSFRFKFALKEGGDTPHAVKMVRRELGIWKRLDHPNIVPFLGTATGFGMQGSLALVSEWMTNGSLQGFLEMHGEQLHVSHQLQFLQDVANGLEYLHSFHVSPIVHGDLNSKNVLVDGDFNARLVDFGYSTVVGIIPEALTYLRRSTTGPGALRWSAPELILADEDEKAAERTPKSDIYSFGCLCLQVFSGKQPWWEVGEEGTIPVRMFKGQMPKRPESRAMEDRYWEFIQWCWASVEERPTAGMLASALQDFSSSRPYSPSLRDMLGSS